MYPKDSNRSDRLIIPVMGNRTKSRLSPKRSQQSVVTSSYEKIMINRHRNL